MSNSYLSAISRFYRRRNRKAAYADNYRYAADFLTSHPMPQLTGQEKSDVDSYWRQYGIRFSDYTWFQMYYGVTGIHDPRFLPNPVAGYMLYPYYNDQEKIAGWDDKNLYQDMVPQVRFPKALCHCVRGRLYDGQWNYYDRDEGGLRRLAEHILDGHTGRDAIMKITSRTYAGKGVRKVPFASVPEIEKALLSAATTDFIVQQTIEQHPFFAQFNASSVNIIRITSWRYKDEIRLFPASLRYGIEGVFTDVAFRNGQEILNLCGITAEGALSGHFVTLDGCVSPPPQLSIRQCPNYRLMTDGIISAHSHIMPFDLIGWDFTFDADGMPVCIEYNVVWPGTIIYQYANGPFAAEHTDDLLAFLRKPENRQKYVNVNF